MWSWQQIWQNFAHSSSTGHSIIWPTGKVNKCYANNSPSSSGYKPVLHIQYGVKHNIKLASSSLCHHKQPPTELSLFRQVQCNSFKHWISWAICTFGVVAILCTPFPLKGEGQQCCHATSFQQHYSSRVRLKITSWQSVLINKCLH